MALMGARIVLRPTWVGVIDFETPHPSPLGGIKGGRTGYG